jgi:hypothetical protein
MASRPAVAASAEDDERIEGEVGMDVRPHALRERFAAEPAPASDWLVRRSNDEDRHAALDAVLSQWGLESAVVRGALEIGGLEKRLPPTTSMARSWNDESLSLPARSATRRADSPECADRRARHGDAAAEQVLVLDRPASPDEQESLIPGTDSQIAPNGGIEPPESAVFPKSGKPGESGELSLK